MEGINLTEGALVRISGFYNEMTSATTPKPFEITSSRDLNFIEDWKLFDSNWVDEATINISKGTTQYIVFDLLEEKIIPTKMNFKIGGTNTGVQFYVSKDRKNWISFGPNVTNDGAENIVEVSDETLNTKIRYIKCDFTKSANDPTTQLVFFGFRVIQWKELI